MLTPVLQDKATMDWESVESGYLAKILVPTGTQGVKVGTTFLTLHQPEAHNTERGLFTVADLVCGRRVASSAQG
eukprot:6828212-Pyramimonas_sp.AAC.1